MMYFTKFSFLTTRSARYRVPEGLDCRVAEEVLQPSHFLVTLG